MICQRSAGPEWNFSGILRRFRRIRNSEDRFRFPPSPSFSSLRFPFSFCLSRNGFRSDSIKRLFVAAKRRVKRFVRDVSRFSLFFLSLLPSVFSPFPSSSSVSFVPLCYLPLSPLRFISANEPFRDAPAAHSRMRTIWRIRTRQRESRV